MFRGLCKLTILGLFITTPAWAQKPGGRTTPIMPAANTVTATATPSTPALTAAVEKPSSKPQPPVSTMTTISPGELKATPEMWFYEQYMRQYQDPKMAVRANAEFRADQRQRRLAAMQWFGFSNSRPHASPDPFHGDYSPGWSSNNASYPYRWNGNGPTWFVVGYR